MSGGTRWAGRIGALALVTLGMGGPVTVVHPLPGSAYLGSVPVVVDVAVCPVQVTARLDNGQSVALQPLSDSNTRWRGALAVSGALGSQRTLTVEVDLGAGGVIVSTPVTFSVGVVGAPLPLAPSPATASQFTIVKAVGGPQ